MERNEWIVNYLQNKIVKMVDLEDFFTIENKEHKIKVEKISKDTYEYVTDTYTYSVIIQPVVKTTSMFQIREVAVA